MEDYEFSMFDYRIELYFILKKEFLENIRKRIIVRINKYEYKSRPFIMEGEIDDQLFYKHKLLAAIIDMEEFERKIQELSETDFAQKMTECGFDSIEHDGYSAGIWSEFITGISYVSDYYKMFKYISNLDAIILSNKGKNKKVLLSSSDVYQVLNYKFKRDDLNEYNQSLIYVENKKEIEVQDSVQSNELVFKVVEEPKKIILKLTVFKQDTFRYY